MRRLQLPFGVAAVLAAGALAWCGSSGTDGASGTTASSETSTVQPTGDASSDKLAQVLARGTLILFTDPAYPPQSFKVAGAKRPNDTKCAANQMTADQISGYEFDKIFPGCRIIDIHEYLLEKGIRLEGADAASEGSSQAYLYHEPCHNPMKLQDSTKTVKALVGDQVLKSNRCCGESGTLGVTRPDVATQVRFRKEEEIRKGAAELRDAGAVPEKGNVKILTSCPSCLQGLTRYQDDLSNGLLEADYIVVEMARRILGENWMREYVDRANAGGIERVLV